MIHCSLLFILSMSVTSNLKWVSCTEHLMWSFSHSSSLYIIIRTYRSFTFKVFSHIFEFISVCLYFCLLVAGYHFLFFFNPYPLLLPSLVLKSILYGSIYSVVLNYNLIFTFSLISRLCFFHVDLHRYYRELCYRLLNIPPMFPTLLLLTPPFHPVTAQFIVVISLCRLVTL